MSKILDRQVAQYLRMSTEAQSLSLGIQRKAVNEYAAANDLTVVATYEDEACSGLTLQARRGMRKLLSDVSAPSCPFSKVLVYDVSRWGRFQDTDASAYYEYHCRLHGVEVVYVAEPFGAPNSPMGALVKSLKRAMAAEYSRELGRKVRAGHSRAIDLGFQMGERPPLGVARMVVSPDGTTRLLGAHERKGAQSDRIRWVPGPPTESALVRRVFHLYGTTSISLRDLERLLDTEGVRLPGDRKVSFRMLRTILSCEAFIGNFVWGKGKSKRKHRAILGDAGTLRRVENVIEPTVDLNVWEAVQLKLQRRAPCIHRSNERLLGDLRQALELNPALSALELPALGCASQKTYRDRFGSFSDALRLAVGDLAAIRAARRAFACETHRLAKRFTEDFVGLLSFEGFVCCRMPPPLQGVFVEGMRIRVQSTRQRRRGSRVQWWWPKPATIGQEYVLLVRLTDAGTALDFLFLSAVQAAAFPLWSDDEPGSDICRIRSAGGLVAKVKEVTGKAAQL